MTVWGEFIVRLVIAFFLGTAIGMEKKWRTAIKTIKFSTLLAIGTATYAIANAPAKLSAQRLGEAQIAIYKPIAESDFLILGISLICASIIIQKKADYSSVDSAITLWCSGMIGLLIGSGFFILAYSSTIVILITKYLFSSEDPVELTKEIVTNESIQIDRVESLAAEGIEETTKVSNYYHCQIICDLENEANVLASMVQSIQEQNFMLTSLQSDNQSSVEVKINADFMTKYKGAETTECDLYQLELQKIFQNLKSQLGVNSVSWHQTIGD